MISLITISIIAAAFTPVITKKLSASSITVGSMGSSGGGAMQWGEPRSQADCDPYNAKFIPKDMNGGEKAVCVTKYNAGDGSGATIPASVTRVQANIATCSSGRCCWQGTTSVSGYCSTGDGQGSTYSGCNRTLCNFNAASEICSSWAPNVGVEVKTWRLPTKEEIEGWLSDIVSLNSGGTDSLQLCHGDSSIYSNWTQCYPANGSANSSKPCLGAVADSASGGSGSCFPHDIWVDEIKTLNCCYRCQLVTNPSGQESAGTRCVTDNVPYLETGGGSGDGNSSLSTTCSAIDTNCALCDTSSCLVCKYGYHTDADGKCAEGASGGEGGEGGGSGGSDFTGGSEVFIAAGEHEFVVPDGVNQLKVTLVSGGAGGGAGSVVEVSNTIVTSGTGNATTSSTSFLNVVSTGLYTWNVPVSTQGYYAKMTACGGGGGGGRGYGGGNGAYLTNVAVPITKASYTIQIGGAGGGKNLAGLCALGGGGGTSSGQSCGSDGTNYGKSGYVGYDPINGDHGVGGCSGGSGTNGGWDGYKGSYFGGGGGGANEAYGGGGGAATLFRDSELAYDNKYVAGGGGGGGGFKEGEYMDYSGGGGGGGGLNCGNGRGGKNVGYSGQNGTAGENTIFGSGYCSGGGSQATGKSGAMKLWYTDAGTTGAAGGGGGQIVPEQVINVTPGETLTITVGDGAAGGNVGHYNSSAVLEQSTDGKGAIESIVSKITKSNGQILLTTAATVSTYGTTGGGADGTTVGQKGFVTNGKSSTQITVDGYSSHDGNVASGATGGIGGKTVLEGAELHCSPGAGGASGANGADATGYGGCGGGGGGAGGKGGKGAPGYVLIKY